eukprot:CAMPEP_0173398610 /NCGR_PEP_ID=MMETSP1356-20130122/42219_1 /TAXON_ID=77927 ORGANISM="Hemiselmis virescens, Strain PCC157" /NCGR_SAMPLE_ID=MMETSP1356 /ASSEMBLY_ACC=CAM_ASM_000847 /LENGTH=47 /DNA_ID= /DNA_START= /DNA_END= /DNA_ORIENTATION=
MSCIDSGMWSRLGTVAAATPKENCSVRTSNTAMMYPHSHAALTRIAE